MKIVKVLKELTHDDIKGLRRNKKTVPSYLLGRKEVVGRQIRVTDADFDLHKGFFEEIKSSKGKKGKVSESAES